MKSILHCLTPTVCCLSFSVLLWGCSREPFTMVKASGKITYEDGTLIPAEGNYVQLTFYSQTPPRDPKTHPRPGTAEVNLADGTFACVTSHKYSDGLTVGKHKVVVSADVLQEVPKGVPPEYNDPAKTPLEVDTDQQPFVLKMKQPKWPATLVGRTHINAFHSVFCDGSIQVTSYSIDPDNPTAILHEGRQALFVQLCRVKP